MTQPKIHVLQINLSDPVDFLDDVTVAGTLLVNGSSALQDLFSSFSANTGAVSAASVSDNLLITGGLNVETSIVGNTLVIDFTGEAGGSNAGDGLVVTAEGSPEITFLNVVAGDGIVVTGSPGSGDVSVDGTVLRTFSSLNDLGDVIVGSPTIGAILYNDGTTWLKLTRGSAGQVLTMGSPLLPTWSTATGGTSGSPASHIENIVGGDGIFVTLGSPQALIAVDGTVARDGDNISIFTNDAGYITFGSPDTIITQGDNISLLTNDVNYISSGSPSQFVQEGDNITRLVNNAGYLTSLGSPGSAANIVGGDGVIITIGSPQYTVAVDGTVLRTTSSLDDLGDVVAGSPTIGAILYNDGTNWIKLVRGTNGQVLQLGSPLLPSWTTLSAADITGSPVNPTNVVGGDGIVVTTGSPEVTVAVDATVFRTTDNLGNVNDVTLTGSASGDVLYYDGTDWVNLPQGTTGQVLTVGSPGPIVWTTPSSSGGGSPSDQLHVVGGDGIDVVYGSPDVTVAVDGTVIRTTSSLSDLNDVAIGSPNTTDSTLRWDGSNWTDESRVRISDAGVLSILDADNATAFNITGAASSGGTSSITTTGPVNTSASQWNFGAGITATSYGGITESDLLDKSVDETVTGNWLMGDGTDISPNSSSAGQLRIEGNAYRGYVALDATGMHFGHNSTSRILTFDTNETTRMSISGSGAVNVVGALTAATFSGNGASLTTLNAANLSSGIIPLARLSADQHSHGIERAFVNFDRQNGMDLDDYVTAGVYGIGAPATNTPTGVSYDPFIVLENASDVRSQLLVPHTANRPLAWRGITSGTPVDWRYALWGDWDGTSFSVSGVNELKLSSTLFIGGDTTGHFRSVTGDYGSVEVNGTEGSSGSWHGYSIGGRYVFMDNAGDTVGIYNDLDNEWMIKCTRNAEVNLYYNASNKLQTTNTGINVSGDVNAVSFGGITEANLADETGTNVWSGVNTWTGNNNGFRYGINGDYSAAISSSWGSTIWALDSSWQGGTSGSNSSSADVYGLRWFRGSHTDADADAAEGLYLYRGGTNYAAIGSAGAVFNTTIVASGDITANSDISLKDDLLVINNALEKVGALNGYTFTRNDQEDKTRRTGLIAQEVESVLPEAVSTNEKTGIKSLSYGNLAGLFVEAIKELRAEIEELKAERVKD